MYQRIIVPLDGSELAESVVPFVQQLASGLNASVELLRVVNLSHAFPYTPESYLAPDTYELVIEADESAAKDYLDKVAAKLTAAGIGTTTAVVSGFPASAIIDAAGNDPTTLVAMTTHGRSGLARFALGSVAELVLRGAAAPVFLSRPLAKTQGKLDRILVPLDGSAFGERVLPVVEALAPALKASVTLLQVTDKDDETEARSYLDSIADRLRQAGIGEVNTHTSDDPVAEGIIDTAEDLGLDMIAMATHGRSGPGRWVFGSVADRVLHSETVPVLLVRAKE
jgi:nucleotide-binding universal stress UspA family protein